MHDLSLYVLELLENSLRAGARHVIVTVRIDVVGDELAVGVADDGPGLDVSPDQATDPFYTSKTGKRTGLGLPLFREAAEAGGGALVVRQAAELGGVAVEAVMRLSHVDRPPLGDMVETVAVMAATNPQAELKLEVSAGRENAAAAGIDLAAKAAGAAACSRLLATVDAAPAPVRRDTAAPATPAPPSDATKKTPTVTATVETDKRQRSVG